MTKKTGVRRSPAAAGAPHAAAALRGMDRIAAALDRESAALKREDTARAAAEKTATTAYFKGLQRAGAEIRRLPSGAGLLSGDGRGTAKRRSPSRSMASGAPLTALAGLADIALPVKLPFATLTPPYDYEWTWTKRIAIAPGKLEAYAHKAQGKFGFDIASKHSSNQINKCRARAALGIAFRPTVQGVLGIRPTVDVESDWSLKWNMRVAHTYGWTGMLIQSLSVADNELADTPLIDKKMQVFDETRGGGSIGSVYVDLHWPEPEDFWGTSLFVDPAQWYAIWIWCGGGIRAAGWQTYLGANVGSDAAARIDVTVPKIALYFTPMADLLGGPSVVHM